MTTEISILVRTNTLARNYLKALRKRGGNAVWDIERYGDTSIIGQMDEGYVSVVRRGEGKGSVRLDWLGASGGPVMILMRDISGFTLGPSDSFWDDLKDWTGLDFGDV